MHPYLAEFLGTLLLILLGNGAVANVNLPQTKGHKGGWIVITLGYGMAVFVGVWCVAPFSGAHLNPAVTIGLAAAGRFVPVAGSLGEDIVGYIVAQLLGAFAGGSLVLAFYWHHYAACDDPATKLGTFATAPVYRKPISNIFCEMIGTAVLVLAVLFIAEPSMEIDAESTGALRPGAMKIGLGTLGALPVGLLVVSIGLSLGGATGYAINPARDLAPRLAHALLPVPGKGPSDWSYAWIPVVGPTLGGLLAAGIWLALASEPPVITP